MRAIDAKILEELEMLYGDKDCFASINDWSGTAETYWNNLERLFRVAEYAKKHDQSVAKTITAYSKRIVDLFQQTKDYASGWSSKSKPNRRLSKDDYADESWDELEKWTVSQEKLRNEIMKLVELLYSVSDKL